MQPSPENCVTVFRAFFAIYADKQACPVHACMRRDMLTCRRNVNEQKSAEKQRDLRMYVGLRELRRSEAIRISR